MNLIQGNLFKLFEGKGLECLFAKHFSFFFSSLLFDYVIVACTEKHSCTNCSTFHALPVRKCPSFCSIIRYFHVQFETFLICLTKICYMFLTQVLQFAEVISSLSVSWHGFFMPSVCHGCLLHLLFSKKHCNSELGNKRKDILTQ